MHILVAENNKHDARGFEMNLNQLGHTCTITRDGSGVVEAIGSGKTFHAILMSFKIPGMDGFEAARAIREAHHQPPSIIGVTADLSAHDHEHCLAAGMIGCLAKPVSLNDLEEIFVEMSAGGKSDDDPIQDIDFSSLANLIRYCGPEGGLIFDDYCDATPLKFIEMEKCRQREDMETFANLAHQLRGSSSSVGMVALSHWLEKLEVKARSGSGSGIQSDWLDDAVSSFSKYVELMREQWDAHED